MSEAPLAPNCRHCGSTNHSGASECWQCHRRDWREIPQIRPGHSPFRLPRGQRSTFVGGMVLITTILITVVSLAFRAGQVVGLVILILSLVILALAIALFSICMALTSL